MVNTHTLFPGCFSESNSVLSPISSIRKEYGKNLLSLGSQKLENKTKHPKAEIKSPKHPGEFRMKV